jgi:dTDP-4-amino-4,6-dideoxygalactose transaminase
LIKFLDLHAQYQGIREEVEEAIHDVIRQSAYIGGPFAAAFERDFAEYQRVKSCVGVGNGTDAIEIALEGLRLPPQSEVIVPANSFIATSEAVTRSGLRVVFADVDPATYTLDVEDVRRRIGPSTSAIVAVHLYGQPCDMEGILGLAQRHRLKVIEDCAQAHGAEYKGRRVGTLGDIGTFSFYPGKNLGAYGDAGAIVTNDEELAKRCRMIANHGRIEKYNHELEGRNSRMDGIQAAVLRVKLHHLDGWIDRRNAVARQYLEGLVNVGDVILPSVLPYVRHVFHLFVIRTGKRDRLKEHLQLREIETGVHYPIALPKLGAYAHLGMADADLVANRLDDQLLSIPMGEHLSDSDVGSVVEGIRSFFQESAA